MREFNIFIHVELIIASCEQKFQIRFLLVIPANVFRNSPWVSSDITYISTAESWLYLAGHKDLCTGEIGGYAMADRITKKLASQSLFRAATKRPAKGLIHHSDRGSRYCANAYRKLLEQFGMKASMSPESFRDYDNAPMESFRGTLKSKLVHHSRYRTRQEAIQDITEYIEIFYNRQKRQKRLGHLSPAAYEKLFY
ncbi:MAG TPA: IS3 family transposase [Nitrospiraceae bacterium]|nr:IS3 family transposase [Nitrospiraceae bacterium]